MGWKCIHRHLYVTILSALFRVRVRQQLSPSAKVLSDELLILEQDRQAYHQRRNAAAARSHRKTRLQQLRNLGIDPDQIQSVADE